MGGCFVGAGKGEGVAAGDLVGETEQGEPDTAVAVVEVEPLGGGAAPVVTDWDDTFFACGTFVVEDLGKRVGLLAVVVA